MTELINKYRPQTFEAVVGHDPAVKALQGALKKGSARAFLFTGGSGVGKTTLARIVAHEAGCEAGDIIEVDAASKTGIDDMREVAGTLQYKPFNGGQRAIIVDEVHALSKPASQSLLKILEEPPPWAYWMLCTTEANRVLPTLKTRCLHLDLKPIAKKVLVGLLATISKAEKLSVTADILDLCAEEANGSARQALAHLAAVVECEDVEEAAEVIGSAVASPEVVELARALLYDAWPKVQGLLKGLKGTDPESARRVLQAYFNTVVLNAKREQDAENALGLLKFFTTPFYTPADLTLACGRAMTE